MDRAWADAAQGYDELGAEVQEIDQLVRKLKRDSFGPESLPHWASMEEGIAEIEQCQASHGGRVALLLLPNHTNLRDPKRKRLGNSRELLQVPDAVPVLDVYNVFREATLTSIQEPDSQGSGLFHPVDIGHPTKRGHRLLGLEMVRQLSEFPGLLHP